MAEHKPTLLQKAENYVAGHGVMRHLDEVTVGGKVTISTVFPHEFITVEIQRKAGDTGKYAWCLADDFSRETGGDILVYDVDGTDAPDGTRVRLWCETL